MFVCVHLISHTFRKKNKIFFFPHQKFELFEIVSNFKGVWKLFSTNVRDSASFLAQILEETVDFR